MINPLPPPETPAPTHVLREAWTKRRSLPRGLNTTERARVIGLAQGCYVARVPGEPQRILGWPLPVFVVLARIGLHPDGGWACAWTEAETVANVYRLPRYLRLAVLLRRRLGRRGLRALLDVPNPALVAWALQRTSSWARVLGDVLDHDPDPRVGTLCTCRVPGIAARLLVVQCPSTGLRHVLCVPPEAGATARDARRWTFRGIEPEIET